MLSTIAKDEVRWKRVEETCAQRWADLRHIIIMYHQIRSCDRLELSYAVKKSTEADNKVLKK